MASSMASSLLRRTARLASPSSLLLRRHHSAFCLPPAISSSSSSSSRLVLSVRTQRAAACPRLASAPRLASSAAEKTGDRSLTRVLQSEIDCAKEDVESHGQDDSVVPKNFPFTIIDNPGDQTITLKREFGNETIEVSVFVEAGEEEVEEDDQGQDAASDAEEEPTNLSVISLVVTVDKGNGPSLEFCCSLTPDEINIESLSLKSPDTSDDQSAYEGPEFTDLDESLQKGFYNFLEQRGIKPSLASFLQAYMNKKEEREYLTWLKNMKEFIEK